MVIILDLILAINVYLAYRYFKTVISPPFLMGVGMLMASIIATTYYDEWEMKSFLPESVMILGIGTLWFTICCIAISQLLPTTRIKPKNILTKRYIDVMPLTIFYVFSNIVGVIGVVALFMHMNSFFGSFLILSELISNSRNDVITGQNLFHVPRWIGILNNYSYALYPISVWLLCVLIFNKKSRTLLALLCSFQVLINIFIGFLSGAKGNVVPIIMNFFVVYAVFHYVRNHSFYLHRYLLIKIIILFAISVITFKGFNELIGRDVEDKKSSDFFALYCGAEIKNFDLYMHGSVYNLPSFHPGDRAFRGFYTSLYPKKYDNANIRETFNYVNNYQLGNVNTQFYYFHVDYGIVGVFFMQLLLAVISMILYKYGLKALFDPLNINIALLLYATYAFQIFMAFFSNRFITNVVNLNFPKKVIWLALFVIFVERFYLHKSYTSRSQMKIEM